MVQFVRGAPSKKDESIGILSQALGEGLGNFTGNYFANKALEGVINDQSLKEAPTSERLSRLQAALQPYGRHGENILQKRAMVEQQRHQEQEQEVLADIYKGKDVSEKKLARLSPENQFKALELQKKKQVGRQIKESLIKAGYPEETAALWQNQIEAAPVGGQTDVIKQVNDLIKRSPAGKGQFGEEEKPKISSSIEVPGIDIDSYELDFPELKTPIGRTAADIVKNEEKNRELNAPLYAETIDSLNVLDEDFRDFQQLQEYNETPGALPTGLEKWNVDWDTGDLRYAAFATPETANYVKILARLLGRAKEYFPGRVTNFDLAQFKKRFPGLANNPEGRKLITEQLILANRIAFLKDETLKAAIDHYGSESDPTQIRKYANENYRRLKGELEKELKGLNQQADSLSSENKSEITPGEIRVRINGQEGTMPREQYERAKSQGVNFELIE